MFENNRGTNWNFPTWEQEQEMQRMAEIQARAYQEVLRKEAQLNADRARRAQRNASSEGDGPKRMNRMAQHIYDAVTSAPDYAEKQQRTLTRARNMQEKGGAMAKFGAMIEAICK